mgnify:CR=1 FL=1
MKFLESVANYYATTFSHNHLDNPRDWSRLCFVFPSHRAGSFFREALHQQIKGQVVFGFRIATIDELMYEWQNEKLHKADELTLTFELYKIYYAVLSADKDINENYLDFDFFFSWAKTFLGDFDDIDKYLIDPKNLFSKLLDHEALTDDLSHLDESQRKTVEHFWNVTFEKNEDDQYYHRIFLTIYSHMQEIYERFKALLEGNNMAYTGMIYRRVEKDFHPDKRDKEAVRYVFIGFNALSTTERIIFRRLLLAGQADFFWDYTSELIKPIIGDKGEMPYLDTPADGPLPQPQGYGASRFVRIYSSAEGFKEPDDYIHPDDPAHPMVRVTSVAYSQSQVAIANEWLQEIKNGKDNNSRLDDTAIVLGDEEMLLPLISAIQEPMNITMGYSLHLSQIASLINIICQLLRTYNGNSIKSRTALQIIQHPVVMSLDSERCQRLQQSIVKSGRAYVNMPDLTSQSDLLNIIFSLPTEATEVANYTKVLSEKLYSMIPADNEKLLVMRESAYKISCLARRFCDLIKPMEKIVTEIKSPQLIMQMFLALVNGEKVDFEGEPLEGLQVMGLMETRALNFRNLCILSLNEGKIPNSSSVNTFIPQALRHAYGLPTPEFRDSIFAYYFFRLLNNAENIELVYQNGSDDGEISRFIMQLKYQYGWSLKERVGVRKLEALTSSKMPVAKSADMIERLRRRFSEPKYLSPSAITVYKKCQKQFFFSYVVGLKEADEISEDADYSEIGTIFHNVMEELYKPLYEKNILLTKEEKKIFKQRKDEIRNIILKHFREVMKLKDDEELHGRNILYREAIEKYVTRLLETDVENIRFEEPEFKVKRTLRNDSNIQIGGIIDRRHIDSEGRRWVVDYKTGNVEKRNFVGFDKMDKDFDEYKVVFQTLAYCVLLNDDNAMPGVISVRKLGKKSLETVEIPMYIGKDKQPLCYADVKEEFEKYLNEIVDEIFNESIPFAPCSDSKNCKNCPFTSLCESASSTNNKNIDNQ